jgi:hypothetical protein
VRHTSPARPWQGERRRCAHRQTLHQTLMACLQVPETPWCIRGLEIRGVDSRTLQDPVLDNRGLRAAAQCPIITSPVMGKSAGESHRLFEMGKRSPCGWRSNTTPVEAMHAPRELFVVTLVAIDSRQGQRRSNRIASGAHPSQSGWQRGRHLAPTRHRGC